MSAPFNELFQAAVEYSERGFSVIPIAPKSKKPLIAWSEFQSKRATREELENRWMQNPDANIGIVTGIVSGLVVVDLDSADAKEKLKQIVGMADVEKIPRSRTGKGWQLFFAHPGQAIPNATAILPGLDIRGNGGYVIAPPSIHPTNKTYRWEVPLSNELPKIPAELFKLITEPPEQTYRSRFNTAEALNGVEEGRRDETCFKLACKLRRADIPQPMAETLILEAARSCEPPFPEKIALEKIARAYRKFEPKQNAAKEPEFWPEFLTAKDLLSLPPDPTRWIWKETLPFGGGSVLVSKPKIGKSTQAVNLSIAISRGLPFLGRDTIQCPVAYLSLDASLPEIAETFQHFGLRETDPIFIHAGAAPKEAIKWLVERVREKGVRFVVVDTLQRLFRFQNLNDYSEVTNTLEPLLEAVREQNAHVMFLHHAKKDAGDDLDSAIGSTAIRGLSYTYLHLKRLPNSERRILRSDQRGGKNFSELQVGFDRATGWLEVKGTMEEAEIEEAKPKIAEALETADAEMTETEIARAVVGRAIITSKALRQMYKANQLDRTGDGRKGRPFRYSLSASLGFSSYINSIREQNTGKKPGTESEKQTQTAEMVNKNSVPENSGTTREPNGTESKKAGGSGTESEEIKKLKERGWEDPRDWK